MVPPVHGAIAQNARRGQQHTEHHHGATQQGGRQRGQLARQQQRHDGRTGKAAHAEQRMKARHQRGPGTLFHFHCMHIHGHVSAPSVA
jgi:hypothetical protein